MLRTKKNTDPELSPDNVRYNCPNPPKPAARNQKKNTATWRDLMCEQSFKWWVGGRSCSCEFIFGCGKNQSQFWSVRVPRNIFNFHLSGQRLGGAKPGRPEVSLAEACRDKPSQAQSGQINRGQKWVGPKPEPSLIELGRIESI